LLNTKQRVNFKNIESVPDGYSCIIDQIEEGQYYEVFKYVNKVYGEDETLLRYDQFKVLQKALYGRRCIQGYGIFYGIKDDEEIDESFIEARKVVRAYLQQQEQPISIANTLDEVFGDMCKDRPRYNYLNMKAIHNLDGDSLNAIIKQKDNDKIQSALKNAEVRFEAQKKEKKEDEFNYNFARLWGCYSRTFDGTVYFDSAKYKRKRAEYERNLKNSRFANQSEMELPAVMETKKGCSAQWKR
jgi:hypothetical protein